MRRNNFIFWTFIPIFILLGFLFVTASGLKLMLLYLISMIVLYFTAIKLLK